MLNKLQLKYRNVDVKSSVKLSIKLSKHRSSK